MPSGIMKMIWSLYLKTNESTDSVFCFYSTSIGYSGIILYDQLQEKSISYKAT